MRELENMKAQVEIPYRAVKRTALDGKIWWVIWDNVHNCYSTRTDHGKYRTKKAAEWRINKTLMGG